MSQLFAESHRSLQDAFGTRALAGRIEELAVASAFDDFSRAFIESRDMFFLATVDAEGRPTVSYKGGDPGFVRVQDASTLVFPSYDGNGMYLSMGNLSQAPEIGMLFIAFDRPYRLRVQGRACLSREAADLALFPEAELVVRVEVSQIWPNCPRYVHRYEKVQASRYVPRSGCETPLATWKRVDILQDVLPAAVTAQATATGTIGLDTWMEKVVTGDPEA